MSGCGSLKKRTAALRSADPVKRQKTLIALKELAAGDKGISSADLHKAVEHILATDVDPSARALAADVLGELALPAHAEQLSLSLRQDSQWIVRRRAARALVKIKGSEAAQDIALCLKNDPHPFVRVEAIELAASALEPKRAAELILEGLKDEALEVRLAAYLTLKDLTGLQVPTEDYELWQVALRKLHSSGGQSEGQN